MARDSAHSLLGLLNDILDFSKIEAGRMELDPAPARLTDVLGNAATVFEPLTRARDLTFHVDLQLPADVWHVCDAMRIKQIIFNLLSNTVKFTARGGIAFILRAIFESSLQLASRLKLKSVAEGIERDEEWSLLKSLGCDIAQGYFTARPMPAEAVPEWHQAWVAGR